MIPDSQYNIDMLSKAHLEYAQYAQDLGKR